MRTLLYLGPDTAHGTIRCLHDPRYTRAQQSVCVCMLSKPCELETSDRPCCLPLTTMRVTRVHDRVILHFCLVCLSVCLSVCMYIPYTYVHMQACKYAGLIGTRTHTHHAATQVCMHACKNVCEFGCVMRG